MKSDKIAYTVEEVAELISIPVSTLYAKIRSKEFPSLKIGRHIRITKDMLNKHLEKLADDNLW